MPVDRDFMKFSTNVLLGFCEEINAWKEDFPKKKKLKRRSWRYITCN